MNKLFKLVGQANPARSMFNLSYEKKLTCDMGQLIPVMCDEAIPGDVWTVGNQMILRFNPLVAPVLHEINVYVHYFFVPYRLLWDEWEDFITGGVTGNLTPTLPRWQPIAAQNDKGTLWDYLGFPVDVIPNGALPMDFPRQAYYFIYNEYYRDETLIPEVDWWTDTAVGDIMLRAWEKDYFTSAQTTRQRGTAPALPLAGTVSATWDINDIVINDTGPGVHAAFPANHTIEVDNTGGMGAIGKQSLHDFLETNQIDLSSGTPFDIAEIREAFQVQRFLERNQRAGARYTEFLGAHFGVKPTDERLDRPEYIGGSKCPVIISEVLATFTDASDTFVGSMSGHGIAVNQEFIAKYRVQEFGLIMGIMSVMPKPQYSQGINRQWLRETKYDFYFPEFAHLSEQAIIRAEIFASDDSGENNTIFGYAGAYDEMRTKQNMVCDDFRDTFDYWHLAREFGAAPTLNQSFIECVPRKDIFAVSADPGLLVSFGNIISCLRPMPIIAEPGLIDHG